MATQPQTPTLGPPGTLGPAARTRNAAPGLNVLLVEDNPGDARLIREMLAEASHTPTCLVHRDRLGSALQRLREPGIDAVLLDNMAATQLREAVELVGGRAVVEASGGVSLSNVNEIAATGVDVISVGWITHSAPVLDLGMDVPVG